MTEFVRVMYPDRRGVTIDGSANGFTNRLLQVQAGTHTFGLVGKPDYTPPSMRQSVSGTSATMPLILQFMPVAAAAVITASIAPLADEEPAPARKRRAPAKKKTAAAKKSPRKSTSKKPAAKKPAAKTSSSKKSSSKKSTAKKSTARKSSSKKSTSRKSARKSSRTSTKGRSR